MPNNNRWRSPEFVAAMTTMAREDLRSERMRELDASLRNYVRVQQERMVRAREETYRERMLREYPNSAPILELFGSMRSIRHPLLTRRVLSNDTDIPEVLPADPRRDEEW